MREASTSHRPELIEKTVNVGIHAILDQFGSIGRTDGRTDQAPTPVSDVRSLMHAAGGLLVLAVACAADVNTRESTEQHDHTDDQPNETENVPVLLSL